MAVGVGTGVMSVLLYASSRWTGCHSICLSGQNMLQHSFEVQLTFRVPQGAYEEKDS